MEKENSKNDLLKEIVNFSNMDDLDLMIDTSKFGNIMKDLELTKNDRFGKMKSTKFTNFNTDQALSSNKSDNSQIQQGYNVDNSNDINKIQEEGQNKEKKNSIFDEAFDEADDIINNFTKKLKEKENTNKNLLINKSQSAILESKLKPVSEEKEKNVEITKEFKIEDKKGEIMQENKNDNTNKDMNKIENEKINMVSLKSCEFNKEENKKALGSIFEMLDFDNNDKEKKNNNISSKELDSNKAYENINKYKKEINTLKEKKDEMIMIKIKIVILQIYQIKKKLKKQKTMKKKKKKLKKIIIAKKKKR